ncbi:hypothetical protein RMATCC62417_16480 [Rhizopus microsporus]|nr:hypothetical protein RMATCC62417_16480 [Rhizopus microsporus]
MQIKLVILTICASLVAIGFAAPSPQVGGVSLPDGPPPGAPGGPNPRTVDPSADGLFLPPAASGPQAFDPSKDNGIPPDAAGPLDVGSTED